MMQPPITILSRFTSFFTETPESQLRHLNASWVTPGHARLVTIYVRKKDNYVKMKGSYDINQLSWIKANGQAAQILGWEE